MGPSHDRHALLKRTLEAYRRHLERSLRARLDEVRAHHHDGKVPEALDAADAAASDLDQHCGIALAEMTTQTLRHVDLALARLDRGDYGFCTDCGEPIADKRLRALPFVRRCRECEDLQELGDRARRLSARNDAALLAYDGSPQHVARMGGERSNSGHGRSIR